MNKPAIDDLLAQIPSYYELTVASASRAREIKVGNREHPQPLQTALEEVTEGKIEVFYAAEEEPRQTELALEPPVAALPPPPVAEPVAAAAEADESEDEAGAGPAPEAIEA